VIDITDPTDPTIVGSVDTPGGGQDVYVSGNHAYVAADWKGLQVVDVSDPTNPTIVGSADIEWGGVHDDEIHAIFVSGNYAYVGGAGLWVINITDPTNPTMVGPAGPGASDIFVLGNYAYLPAVVNGFGLRVVDVSDPTNPTMVGSAGLPSAADAVYVSGNHAYVAGSDLWVIDITDPTDPTIVGSAPGGGNGVFVSGNHAYVAADWKGLQVVDVSDPTNPTIVGSAGLPSGAGAVYVSGNYAYLAASGLQVLRAFEPCTNVAFVNSTTLNAAVPPGLPKGTYNLHAVNPNGERAILHNSFTVLEMVNDLVTFDPDPSTYDFTPDTTGCPTGFAGKFSFDATLTNISAKKLSKMSVQIDELTNDNLCLTDMGLIGESQLFEVPKFDDYADGYLSHDEYVDFPFTVCLNNTKPFRFFVNVVGVAAD